MNLLAQFIRGAQYTQSTPITEALHTLKERISEGCRSHFDHQSIVNEVAGALETLLIQVRGYGGLDNSPPLKEIDRLLKLSIIEESADDYEQNVLFARSALAEAADCLYHVQMPEDLQAVLINAADALNNARAILLPEEDAFIRNIQTKTPLEARVAISNMPTRRVINAALGHNDSAIRRTATHLAVQCAKTEFAQLLGLLDFNADAQTTFFAAAQPKSRKVMVEALKSFHATVRTVNELLAYIDNQRYSGQRRGNILRFVFDQVIEHSSFSKSQCAILQKLFSALKPPADHPVFQAPLPSTQEELNAFLSDESKTNILVQCAGDINMAARALLSAYATAHTGNLFAVRVISDPKINSQQIHTHLSGAINRLTARNLPGVQGVTVLATAMTAIQASMQR